MACSSSCPTPGAHSSWGQCVKAKGIQIGDIAGRQINLDGEKELDAYRAAVAQGIQPLGTKMAQVEAAVAVSDITGTAYRAD